MGNNTKNPAKRHAITFGNQTIEFSLEFRERKHMAIHVYPDKHVAVVAPTGKELIEVLARVRKRAPWILSQLDHFEQFQPTPTPRRYVAGETHLYLGRQYRLKVSAGDEESVKLVGRFLRVTSQFPKESARTRELVQAWYLDHAKSMFARRLEACLARGTTLRVERPRLIVRRMKKRWGSCSKAGNLALNVELVKAPLSCIDYVITHELCHLRIREHTPTFYRLLTRCMPDWEKRKDRLEKVVL